MTTIDIQFDPHRSKELYTKYFRFERKKAFEKVPIKLLYGIWGVLVITGISLRIDALWIIGLISAALTTAFLLYYVIRFQIAFTAFLKELEKKAKSDEVNFQFGFDSESVVYKSENVYSEIKWNRIKEYAINGEDIYLYLENRELLDIISKRILGETMFDRFKTILLEKCKQNTK
ncbi:YcxB family protein [uncultured Fluviicola sp.]|uniref:YcxB family protein n=1 Tax=uncultured Fluviicola sp. TaxID=463303 RepID=UPI0025DE4ABA|nr:YcxB family protein [uncultured Fluviicola sp.]